jgi:asparagine synthase (glutamine-hydrolysing)
MAYRGALFHPAVAELAWSFSSALRDHNGESRNLVRGVIAKSVPRELFERRKAGFDVPFHLWLRTSLRDIGEDLLSERRLRADGIFDSDAVHREWDQHQSGKHDRRFILFDLISFQLWLESMRLVPSHH